jgi:hypothetical protein
MHKTMVDAAQLIFIAACGGLALFVFTVVIGAVLTATGG